MSPTIEIIKAADNDIAWISWNFVKTWVLAEAWFTFAIGLDIRVKSLKESVPTAVNIINNVISKKCQFPFSELNPPNSSVKTHLTQRAIPTMQHPKRENTNGPGTIFGSITYRLDVMVLFCYGP